MSTIAYEQLYHLDVESISTAVDRWSDVIRRYQGWDQRYGDDVVKPFAQAGWTSIDGTSMYAQVQVAGANKEFSDAVIEAKGIRAVLQDAYEELRKYKADLHQVTADAKKAGVVISSTGKVTLRDPDEKGDERRGPGGVLPSENEEKVLRWQAKISFILVAAANADQSAAIALKRNTGKGGDEGFNDKTVKSVDQDESQRATKLLDKVEKGDKLSPAELKELERLMSHNQKDPEFSKMLLDKVGPENAVKLTNQLNELAYDTDKGNQQRYTGIQQGLANAIATGTRDPDSATYKKWRAGMEEVGMKRYEWQGEEVRGYQSLVTLMQHGDGYSDRFLHDLGDGIIAAEKADDGDDNWDKHKWWINKHDGYFANDPMDGLLKVMSRDPDAAAAFLDPKSDPNPDDDKKQTNDRLEYLTRERDWNVVDGNVAIRNPHDPDSIFGDPLKGSDIEDPHTREGLAAALTAGATGIDPANAEGGYVEHSAANRRVFEASLKHLSDEGNDFPPQLRTPMAQVMGNWGDDVHQTTSAHNDGEAPLKRGDVLEVAKQISRDPHAYGTLQDGINREIVHDINVHEGGSEESLRRAGNTIGFLEEARYQALKMDADDEKSKAMWEAKWDYHTWGGVVNFVPYAGDAAQRGVDVITAKWLDEENERIDAGLARENMATNQGGEGRLKALAQHWRRANPDASEGESQWLTVDRFVDAANNGNAAARSLSGGGS
ncbi:DUF6571 family protein [Streptomyces cavernicola]|uniref:DUF6571 domain-containing protein n=1 Tax=Streptomyces cavernicola TaxID=3043613 RepID=A0ABT6SEW0_9ACTN|nr:DUF6571 family protein [Streptomyces sp. B-S-A6]MDI3406464.1 hypothetical protein [Streptomyces sp. B-S-A6]